jgi:hypothetical protein
VEGNSGLLSANLPQKQVARRTDNKRDNFLANTFSCVRESTAFISTLTCLNTFRIIILGVRQSLLKSPFFGNCFYFPLQDKK